MSTNDGTIESTPAPNREVSGSTSTEASMTNPCLMPISRVPRYCICILICVIGGVLGAVIAVVFTVGRGSASASASDSESIEGGDVGTGDIGGGSGGQVSGNSGFVQVQFKDKSIEAGLIRDRPRKKYGGAFVGDLDGDSKLDLVLVHHDDWNVQLYYGNGDGTFNKWQKWELYVDAHAVVGVRMQPWDRRMHFLVTRGGGNGLNPQPQLFYRVEKDRQISQVSKSAGIVSEVHGRGRGRSGVFLNLKDKNERNTSFADAVFTFATPWEKSEDDDNGIRETGGIQHWGYEGVGKQRFRARNFTGKLLYDKNEYATVADVNMDGRVELLTFLHDIQVYKVQSKGFQLDDITDKVLPKLNYRGTIAITEFDFDNDQKFDLFIARTDTGSLKWMKNTTIDTHDYLLKNMGGYYVDISEKAGIPRNQLSTGVTAGDFDNDGFVDLIVNRWDKPDLLLRNQGGVKFVPVNAGFNRAKSIPGDMATAADLDGDGRLDLVLSEGHWHKKDQGGFYRIMMNTSPAVGNYLAVRVLSSPKLTATSLHAVVTISLGNGKLKLIRRVGSPGTAVSVSYIETVHFGVGKYKVADVVNVQWTDGSNVVLRNVKMGRMVEVGARLTR